MTLPFPDLGDPLPPRASPDTVRLLLERRSSSAQTLGAPGPSPDELDLLLRLGARVPDHGKLAPWRFVLFTPPAKAAYVARLEALAAGLEGADQKTAKLGKLRAAPVTIAVISRPNPAADIPVWEQELSAGAVCLTLLTAAAALGYGANWITDWYAYDEAALTVLGVEGGERVAGFIHVGTPAEPPLERVRPEVGTITTWWASEAS